MTRLSIELNRYFFEEERKEKIKLFDLFDLAGERIFGFLFVILSLPSALPIPAPGYSIPFGVIMFLLAIQLIFGRKTPWLPSKLLYQEIKLVRAQGFVKAGIPWLKRIENLTRPRMNYVCNSLSGQVVIGFAIALMSVCMMIPIPGTNTLPAIGIFITGFGLQEDDGFISLIGLVVCSLGVLLVTGILFTGVNILSNFKDWLLDFFSSEAEPN